MSCSHSLIGELDIKKLKTAEGLFKDREYHQAEKLLVDLLKTDPNNFQAIRLLSQIGITAGAYLKVIPLLERCIDIKSDDATLILQLAQIWTECDYPEKAELNFQSLVKKFPDWPIGHFSYAGFLQSFGRIKEAIQTLNRTLELDPKHAGAYLALANIRSMEGGHKLTKAISTLLSEFVDQGINQVDQMKLYYALGKAKSDQKEYRSAFECWQKANAIQLKFCDFRVTQMFPFYEQLKKSFKEISYLPVEKIENTRVKIKPTPIFIVGLPRSGSTLLAQMLSGHSQIESVGEVTFISNQVVGRLQQMTGKPYPIDVHKLNAEQWTELGEVYLKQIRKTCPNSHNVIDKLPANFQSIGLIKKILPQAKIINIQRKPEAIAISIFKNYFAQNEPYFCDLKELAMYYRSYKDLMSFWLEKDTSSVIDLTYENLVAEPKKELQQLLNDWGLAWEESCLKQHTRTERISTLSDIQVRKPIYKSSVNDWKKYQTFISDFITMIS